VTDRTGGILFFLVMGLGVMEEFIIAFGRMFVFEDPEAAIIEGLLNEPIEQIEWFHKLPF
jgi:hypothetical protein